MSILSACACAASASRFFCSRSKSRDFRIFIAVARFFICERSFWHCTTTPVGMRDPDGRVSPVDVLFLLAPEAR